MKFDIINIGFVGKLILYLQVKSCFILVNISNEINRNKFFLIFFSFFFIHLKINFCCIAFFMNFLFMILFFMNFLFMKLQSAMLTKFPLTNVTLIWFHLQVDHFDMNSQRTFRSKTQLAFRTFNPWIVVNLLDVSK
jgi:hypothetical protein